MCANNEGSGETARLRRLAWVFAVRLCDMYHNLMSWLNYITKVLVKVSEIWQQNNSWYCFVLFSFVSRSDKMSLVSLATTPRFCIICHFQVGNKISWWPDAIPTKVRWNDNDQETVYNLFQPLILVSDGPRQTNLVLIAYASSEGSGEPAHPLAHTSSESRGTFRRKARSLAPLNGWACAVKTCHDGMLEDTNSLDSAQMIPDPL